VREDRKRFEKNGRQQGAGEHWEKFEEGPRFRGREKTKETPRNGAATEGRLYCRKRELLADVRSGSMQ